MHMSGQDIVFLNIQIQILFIQVITVLNMSDYFCCSLGYNSLFSQSVGSLVIYVAESFLDKCLDVNVSHNTLLSIYILSYRV